MTYERDPTEVVNPTELLAPAEPIISIGSQQWYPTEVKGCHQVIRGLAADLAGQVQETQRLVKERDELKIALAYFTQTN